MELTKSVQEGSQEMYSWLEIRPSYRLDELVQLCPALIFGHRVAVTSFDSGVLALTPTELSLGWVRVGRTAVSPVVSDVDQIPNAEWDEWYINPELTSMNEIEVFVNDPTFSMEQTTEEAQLRASQRFWNQLRRVTPLAFMLSNSARCIVLTRDADLFREMTSLLREHI
jgi:hypothetical protein